MGTIDVYNLLPAYIVAAEDVSTFQNRLQQLMKLSVGEAVNDWSSMLSNRHLIFRHPLLRCSGFAGSGKNMERGMMNEGAQPGLGHKVKVPVKDGVDRPPTWW